jgi:hypothetical protein
MVSDKISSSDLQNLAKGVLIVTLPDYKACRTAVSLATYTKDTWDPNNGPKPNFTSDINKETNTITITCTK